MKRIAILGGGIAGLSAAWSLDKVRRAGHDIEYRLYEAAGRLGGVIASETIDGCVVEAGPDSFLTEKPAAAQLCREIGLADDLLGSNDTERKTYIVVGKRLIPLPDGLMFMVPTKLIPTALSRLFSLRTKLQMAREYLFPPEPATSDESVAEMTRRHFGQETVDRLVSPLLAGVYGGDADELSVRAVLARMAQMEQKHRSLTRGMLAAHKQRGTTKNPAPLFTTLRGGMSQMVDGIAAQLPPEWIHLNTEVHAIDRMENAGHGARREPAGWIVETPYGQELFDALILALPAWGSASLLRPIDHPVAETLSGIPYSSSVTVTLGYEIGRLLNLPHGFGFLVPATENRALLACTFVHTKFAGRVPDGKGLLRCFLGGARNDELLDENDARLTVIVLKELEQILGLKAPPSFVRIHRSRQAMAQYGVGHLDRIQLVKDRIAELPGIALAGNAYQGIGVPDCIRTGQEAAESALRAVRGAAVGAGAC